MPPFDSAVSMTDGLTHVDEELSVESPDESSGKSALRNSSDDKWETFLDKLIDWGKRAAQIDDDGLQAPTLNAINAAFLLLKKLQPVKFLPYRMVSNGEGGISLELIQGSVFAARLEIDSRGKGEYLTFKNNKLASRHSVDTH